jgi:hypothetical protein
VRENVILIDFSTPAMSISSWFGQGAGMKVTHHADKISSFELYNGRNLLINDK